MTQRKRKTLRFPRPPRFIYYQPNTGDNMQSTAIFIDLLEAQNKGVNAFTDLAAEGLHWRPHPEANSIGITIWHVARVADFVLTVRLEGQPAEAQRWFTTGWQEQTGYDPRGIGAGGMGILTGYSQEEVAALPPLSGEQLLSYHGQVYADLLAHVRQLTDEQLDQPVPGAGEQKSIYFWLRVILLDATRHLGEMQALQFLWQRHSAA
jgi:hypothetical protein